MTMRVRDACPGCGSRQFKRNGHIHNGKQNYQCKTCGYQFVLVAVNRVISAEHRPLVQRLLCEKISMELRTEEANPSWLWLAMDKQTRQILAFHVGDRSRKSAKRLWTKTPAMYREHATFSIEQYTAYRDAIPAAQHKAITKNARRTNHIERFNNTLRQRVSRLVRSPLAFSKKEENHIGAIHYFICHYNLTRAALLV